MTDSEWLLVTTIKAEPHMSKAEILALIDSRVNCRGEINMTVNPKRVALFCQKRGRRK